MDARLELKPVEGVVVTLLPSYQSTSQQTQLDDPTFDFSSELDMRVWGVPTQLAWNHTLFGLGNQLLVGADLLREKVNADSLFDFARSARRRARATRAARSSAPS